MHFKRLPPVADTYESSNRRDVLLTYHLWKRWKDGRLKVGAHLRSDAKSETRTVNCHLTGKAATAYL